MGRAEGLAGEQESLEGASGGGLTASGDVSTGPWPRGDGRMAGGGGAGDSLCGGQRLEPKTSQCVERLSGGRKPELGARG